MYTQGSCEGGSRARNSASRAVSSRVCAARMPNRVRNAAAAPLRSSGRISLRIPSYFSGSKAPSAQPSPPMIPLEIVLPTSPEARRIIAEAIGSGASTFSAVGCVK